MDEKCNNIEVNIEQCPCSNKNCPRYGKCCDCIRAHRARGLSVACMRAEALEESKTAQQ